jgi:hypothetical protein
MLPDLLGVAVVAVLFAVVIVSCRPRAGRVRAAGTARPSAQLPQPAAEGRAQARFVPVSERQPYDSGPLLEENQ